MSNPIVPTIADLKALSLTGIADGDIVQVGGYYAVSDGGGGDFVWRSSVSDPDDGGMVIAPTSGSGRWLRLAKVNRMRAAWYGARPGTAADQTPLIQKAIDKAGDAGGGTVELEVGTYQITTFIKSRSNISLLGRGRRATILQQESGLVNTSVIELGDPTFSSTGIVQKAISIKNLGIDLNNNRSGKGVKITYPCQGIIIEDCDCWLSPVEAGYPYHDDGDDHFVDMSVTSAGINQLWIRGCRVTSCVQLTSNAGGGVDGLYILNNWIEDPVAYGVAITGILRAPGFSIRNVVISGNTFKNVPQGINIGRDQYPGIPIDLVEGQQIVKNILISDNHFIVGGDYAGNSAVGVSVCTYQNEISGIRIQGNTVSLADGTELSGQVGIQLTVFDFNWLSVTQGGVPPVISAVNTGTNTITSDKAHAFQTGMAVHFERATTADVLPAPLVEHRRYRAVRVDATNFQLTEFRTGRSIDLTGSPTGSVKMFFSPCVQDAEISDNIVTGFSEAIRVNGAAGIGIRDNRCVGGSIYFSSASIIEDVTVQDNQVNRGFFSALGNVIKGKLLGNNFDVRDDYFTSGNGVIVRFAPSKDVFQQDWIIRDNNIDLIRLDGLAIFRVAAGFSASRGLGRVTVWEMEDNICSSSVPSPFSEMRSDQTMIVRWGDRNKVRPSGAVFRATSQALFDRFLASTTADSNMLEQQAAAEASGKAQIFNALVMEGRPSAVQATATLAGVSLGAEGRGVSWRYRVSPRTTAQGLWGLSGSTAGHAAHSLYAFEKDGLLTIRQVGATPGSLDTSAGTSGAVTGGDYRQVTVDISTRRNLPTHILVSIDRTGALGVYVEGLSAVTTETVSGSAPDWNDSLIPANPVLNIGFFDTGFWTYEGAFYSFDVLNFAPTSTQAQAIFAGGIAAVPGYGPRTPAELVRNGSFTAPVTEWTGGADTSFSGGVANFNSTANGSGINQGAGDYRKGRAYRLGFEITSYTSGLIYFAIGSTQFRAPLAPSTVGPYWYEGVADESNGLFTVRGYGGGTTLSIDNVSMIQLGSVASFIFDSGIGFQVEDKSELKNHLVLPTAGVGHLRPELSGWWSGKVTASGYLVRDGVMMESGHYITRILAYSAGGATITLGENSSGSTASLVASVALTAGSQTDLTSSLLKRNSSTGKVYCALTSGADAQFIIEYSVPRLLA